MEKELMKEAMHDACIRAVTEISADVKALVQAALDRETNETAKSMLSSMLENLDIAKAQDKAVCQSPGYPTTWISYGDDNFPSFAKDTIAEAHGEATKKGYLRPSIVDPLTRHNPGNNTGKGVPNIEYQYNPGQDYVDFIISFKGCGAELGNAMKIFTTATLKLDKDFEGLKRFVLETAINAGGKPCPPFGIGIGIGGQMDFLEGAYRSVGGKGYICINSARTAKDGTLKSNIVPFIPGGSTVSAPRTMIQSVATEYGIANLSGKTLRERAEAMIAIAHPDFRDELEQYAKEAFH